MEPEPDIASQGAALPTPESGAGDAVAPVLAQPTPPGEQAGGPASAPSTRTSALWTALAVGIVLLVAVIVFILQNLEKVKVTFFAVHWRIPLALDLLLAAVLGGAIVFVAGALRILQLRRHARRRAASSHGHG